MRAAWGRYSQSQPLFSLQAEDGVTGLAAPNAPPAREPDDGNQWPRLPVAGFNWQF